MHYTSRRNRRNPRYGFKELQEHPVHDFFSERRPGLQLKVINYISSSKPWTSLFADLITQGFDERLFIQEARAYLDVAKAIGWDVVEEMYDADNNYPVQAGERCANEERCLWLCNMFGTHLRECTHGLTRQRERLEEKRQDKAFDFANDFLGVLIVHISCNGLQYASIVFAIRQH